MNDNLAHSENTTEHDRIESLAAAYVLGALPETEPDFKEFEALLESGDPYVGHTLEGYFNAVSLLADLAPQFDAPASLKAGLITKATTYQQNGFSHRLAQSEADKAALPLERKLKTKNRTIIGISFVGGLLVCILLALNVSNSAKLDRSNDLMKALLHQTDSLRGLTAATTNTAPASTNGDIAEFGIDKALVGPVISMFQEGSGRKINLSTHTAPSNDMLYYSPKRKVVVVMRGELAPVDENHTYELWAQVGSGAPKPVGTFRIDANSKQPMYAMATTLDAVDSFSLSVEPKGGSQTRTGPVVRASRVASATRHM